MLLVAKRKADSPTSKPRLGEGWFCNGFLFLDGDFLFVRKESLREPSHGRKSPPCFVRQRRGDDEHLRELVFGCIPFGHGKWHQNLGGARGTAPHRLGEA